MREFLPFCAGLAVGGLLALIRPLVGRAVLLPLACVGVGALASWMNGEFGGNLWPLFVSIDAILVWAGAGVASLLLAMRRRTA
ncbi:MAG: hypothetical protein ACRDNX_02420 [Gaiellaceae bacterium]